MKLDPLLGNATPTWRGFGVASALEAARTTSLEDWIQRYLRTGGWINLGLADGLLRAPRWWSGPTERPVTELKRCCGPEADMAYRMPAAVWDNRVEAIRNTIRDLRDFPPLIAAYEDGDVVIRDGNHRFEAFRRAGFENVWMVCWYNSPEDRTRDGVGNE